MKSEICLKESWKMKRFTKFLFIALLAILLTACGKDENSGNQANNNEKVVVNIATLSLTPINVAKEVGYLEEELAKYNATFEYSVHQNGPPINEGIASKRVDFGSLGEGAILGGANNKLDTKLLSLATDGKRGINTIIATKQSGIQSLEQLKGKKIAVALGTSHHVFLLRALEKVGLTLDDVNIVNLSVTDAHPAFQTNQVDAWVTAEMYADLEKQKGAVLLTNGEELDVYSPTFYIARGEFAEKHPELVKAILKAIDRAIELKNTDPEKYYEIAAKVSGYDVSVIKANERYELLNEAPSEELLVQFQETAEIMKKLGYITNDIDVKSLVDTSFINDLK